jgi:hypothetical protein
MTPEITSLSVCCKPRPAHNNKALEPATKIEILTSNDSKIKPKAMIQMIYFII